MFVQLRERNFFLLWTANTISILGDYVFFIAITYWIYAQTGSALATGVVLCHLSRMYHLARSSTTGSEGR